MVCFWNRVLLLIVFICLMLSSVTRIEAQETDKNKLTKQERVALIQARVQGYSISETKKIEMDEIAESPKSLQEYFKTQPPAVQAMDMVYYAINKHPDHYELLKYVNQFQSKSHASDSRFLYYRPDKEISGELRLSVSSDLQELFNNSIKRQFLNYHPKLKIKLVNQGRSVDEALVKGRASIGLKSSKIRDNDRRAFQSKHGYQPTPVTLGYEVTYLIGSAELLTQTNEKTTELSFRILDSMFSMDRERGGRSMRRWESLTGYTAGEILPVVIKDSRAYHKFKHRVMRGAPYAEHVRVVEHDWELYRLITRQKNVIALCDHSFIAKYKQGYQILPLHDEQGKAGFFKTNLKPEPDMIWKGHYAMSSEIYLYFNQAPHTSLNELQKEFLRFLLSADGQNTLYKAGYYPLNVTRTAEILSNFGLKVDF